MNKIRIAAAAFLAAISGAMAAPLPSISSYANAPTALRHAMHRLSDYTGFPLEAAASEQPAIRIELNATPNAGIGAQGYTIESTGGGIAIRANEAEGAANGVYTLLRTLMIEHRKDPFSRKWNIQEKPQFSVRAMLVAPYRYGASYGFAALSPDRWSIEEWREYVDMMRLCNMTTLVMASTRMYHPDYPDSRREQWRFEVWKEVMDYCHQVGMKFNWFIFPNLVTEQAFWDNPDKRPEMKGGAWHGSMLSWAKAKDIILKNQKYTLEFFRGLDGLEIIYNDGGGVSPDIPNLAECFADETRSYIQLLRDTGNDAQFVYWNWLMDLWAQGVSKRDAEKFPKYRTVQDDIVPLLPKNVTWLDASALTQAQTFGPFLKAWGNAPVREGLLIGKEAGFKPVIDFFWYMNPELAINMFPHPFIRRAMQEAVYARDEVGSEGVMGYRLAPPTRFVDDYVFFRLASDPSLTQAQLVAEAAGLLCEKPQNQKQAAEAINTLERFWSTRQLEDLEKADRLFKVLLPEERSKNLEYVSNGVTFLTYVVRMAQPGVGAARKAELKRDLYQTVKPMYIFQGLVADIVWIPEAVRFFSARVDMMVEDYNAPFITSSNSELVDRSVYPKATSKPFTLRWQPAQTAGGTHE
ncbi:MAG: glycoside hydrolase family 20 zincin-like fold domain-containing protein [Acidobacteriia bacterium]|nr:glycoside hydrolase family 20 zincin-like fold domain-containing protein [Terriglobia bacterium]